MRFRSRPWVLVLVAAPALLSAVPARADEEQAASLPLPVEPIRPVQPGEYPAPAPYAPPPPFVADAEHHGSSNWYGWQTLIAVAPFDIAMFAGLARLGDTAGNTAFAVGFVDRNLAPAVVHGAHGRGGAAFGSVGLHAIATATGLVIGYAFGIALQSACPPTASCRNGFRGIPTGPVYGAVAGSMSGTVLDVVFLAYRHKLAWTASAPDAPAAPARSARTAWALAPYVAPSTVGLAVAGTF